MKLQKFLNHIKMKFGILKMLYHMKDLKWFLKKIKNKFTNKTTKGNKKKKFFLTQKKRLKNQIWIL